MFKKAKVCTSDRLRDKNGKFIESEEDKIKRLREHFQEVLTVESEVQAEPQSDVHIPRSVAGDISIELPTEKEIDAAIMNLKI